MNSVIIVKCGTRVLVSEDQSIKEERIQSLIKELTTLRKDGFRPVLVTSGAVALGLKQFKKTRASATPAECRAAAALGQVQLMTIFGGKQSQPTFAQLLLAKSDFENRERFVLLRETFECLIAKNIIPIVNENDVTTLNEAGFRDNDHVAALASLLLSAQHLFLLSNTDGIYRYQNGEPTEKIESLHAITNETFQLVETDADQLSLGGMRSKLLSAQMAHEAGSDTWILHGARVGEITKALKGDKVGTHIYPTAKPLGSQFSRRKAWIAFFHDSPGSVTLDTGATEALLKHARSLLPVGIQKTDGDFAAGSVIRILTHDGHLIGKGIVKVSSSELNRIVGKKTDDVQKILGRTDIKEVINRDDLVIFA